jgi:hypothetical protein
MTSLRQIDANRRNAALSTGPTTEDGKKRSRRNAVRHGLTAETIIETIEEADDYAAFEMAITADYDAQSAVERELVLRLASLLWRLRRATAIESGLFEIQARHLLQFRRRHAGYQARQTIFEPVYSAEADVPEPGREEHTGSTPAAEAVGEYDDLTRAFIRLSNLPTYPLDRLSRYEAALWRQACQILFALKALQRRKPWERARFGARCKS